MSDRERVLVFNAYGDVVDTAEVTRTRLAQLTRYDERAVRVSAPGYLGRTVVLDFDTDDPDVVLLAMDPKTAKGPGLEEACEQNLRTAMDAASVRGNLVSDYFGFAGAVAVKRQQDRCYFRGFDGEKFARDASRTGAWRSVPGGLHKPHEEGFEVVGSWKTTRGAPDLQVTAWRRKQMNSSQHFDRVAIDYVAELDLDLRSGAGHIFEVLENHLTGDKTHPYAVVQALAWGWGEPPFKLEPGE